MNNIEKKISDSKIKFSSYSEHKMYVEMLINYENKLYSSAAIIGAVLYERVITIRLIRETSSPIGFIASKDNIHDQLKFLSQKEDDIINGNSGTRGLGFKTITQQLKELNIIDEVNRQKFNTFYDTFRNPILHHLTIRLFKTIYKKDPVNIFELDTSHDDMYKQLSDIVMRNLNELVSNGGFSNHNK